MQHHDNLNPEPLTGSLCCAGRANGSSRRAERNLVKAGMTVCLGVLVFTGMNRSPSSRRWHVLAGAALVGFSAWHHWLYPSSTRGRT